MGAPDRSRNVRVREAASVLGVSAGLLANLRSQGVGPAYTFAPADGSSGRSPVLYNLGTLLDWKACSTCSACGGRLTNAARTDLLGRPEPSAPASFGPVLRKLRTDAGLRLSDVADAADLSASMISRVERGRATLTVVKLRAIAPLFGMAAWEIIRLAEIPRTDHVQENQT